MNTKHIVSFSGGKDSTAMLLRMIELNYPIDEIVFADTTFEFPELYTYIKRVEKHIGRKITILSPDPELFKKWFYGKYFENAKGETFVELRGRKDRGERPTSHYAFWGKGFWRLHRLILFLNGEREVFKEKLVKLNEFKEKFCKKDGKTCFLEYNPLPLRRNRADDFFISYLNDVYGGVDSYLNKINLKRIELLKKKIIKYNPKYFIFYGKGYGEKYIKDQIGRFGDEEELEINGKNIRFYIGKYKKTKLAIIPHCSRSSNQTYKKIGEILEKLK